MFKILAALLTLVVSTATATPRYWGIDQLGGAKYRDVIVRSHPDGFALGIFTQKEIFGDGYPVVDAALRVRKIPLVRYNLRWSDSHSFSRSDFPRILAEAKRGLPVVNKYPNVECQFSGATEHQLNQRDAQALADAVLAVIPERCIYVNNPWTGRGAFIPTTNRIINEVHGKEARRPNIGGKYNFSFDGNDAFDVDVTPIKNRLPDSEVFFFWTSQNNGRRNAGDSTPRPKRTFWPTDKLLKAMAYLATEQGAVSLPKNYLIKPKSDQHFVPPAPRELKPVFIFPNKSERIVLRCLGKIYTSSKGEPFVDGRRRYYFPNFGYEMGGPCEVFQGNKVGTANPGFRQGGDR